MPSSGDYDPAVDGPIGGGTADGRRPRWRPTTLQVAGVASLANGIALLGTILGGFPLPALLAVTWATAAIAVGVIVLLATPSRRTWLLATIAVGIALGLVATVTYDATKVVLSQLDSSPYNPFEATKVFGRLLLGETASPEAIVTAGWVFHFTNGSTFALAYALLFARGGAISWRRGLVTGIVWGLFLETFQLVLYPGWLNVTFLDEFRQVSFLSHLAYGGALGLLIPAGLRVAGRRVAGR